MAINYTQTDGTTGRCNSNAGYCSGFSTTQSAGTGRVCSDGGTAGTGAVSTTTGAATRAIGAYFTIIPDSGTTGNSGTWTVRLNVTTANMNLTLLEVWICRVNSSCVNQETIGSTTGLTTSLGTTGVKSINVTGSAVTLAADDKVVVGFYVDNTAMSSQAFSFTPDQNIDSPFTTGGGGGATTLDHFVNKDFTNSLFLRPRFLLGPRS